MSGAGACRVAGCPGRIADGWCDRCGMAGHPAAPAEPLDSLPPPPAGSGRPPTTTAPSSWEGSQHLGAAPLGSRRAGGDGSGSRRAGAGTASKRTRRASLGAGLFTIPPQPRIAPESVVLTEPAVPEASRLCRCCREPVGRSRDGRPGRTEGFCPRCRTAFSFTPSLTKGDLVGNQYEVAGALAHGGMGWVFLAWDRHVGQWVVLKGLLDSDDPDAAAAAISERRYLAQVDHPLIVKILNFVRDEGAGYIVMEYVGGTSLKDVLKARTAANGGVYDPLPAHHAIAYIAEILPAFQYLHDAGLLYCDFKPDNLMRAGDTVKLIDLGGVRRLDDPAGDIFGTAGYQAPEVPGDGVSVASDLYTVGRTLLVLAHDVRGLRTTYADRLPDVGDTELFQRHDSLHRLLAKACAPDPADRFQSADELRAQLLGVLREVVAALDPDRALAAQPSDLFDPPSSARSPLAWSDLPALRPDADDPMTDWLRGVTVDDPDRRLVILDGAPRPSPEVRLAGVRTCLDAGRHDDASARIAAVLTDDAWEWRALWLAGLVDLARGDPTAARTAFNAAYGEVPGELAPKLALALACEHSGEHGAAEALYSVCAHTDANYAAPAAFGLARIRTARDDSDGARAALDRIPPNSRAFVEGRLLAARLLVTANPDLRALQAALATVAGTHLDRRDHARLTVDVLTAALALVQAGGPDPSMTLAGCPATEADLQIRLQIAYRELAATTAAPRERARIVAAGWRARPWSLT